MKLKATGQNLPRIAVTKAGEGREPYGDPYWIYVDQNGRQAKLAPDMIGGGRSHGSIRVRDFENNLINNP